MAGGWRSTSVLSKALQLNGEVSGKLRHVGIGGDAAVWNQFGKIRSPLP